MRHGTCIHFKAIRGRFSVCAKGVNYHNAFGNGRTSVFTTMPCVTVMQRFAWEGEGARRRLVKIDQPVNREGEAMMECAMREFPTDEMVRGHEATCRSNVQRAHGSTAETKPAATPARNWWDDRDDD